MTTAGDRVAPASAVQEAARIADWDEPLCTLEMVFEDLFMEVEHIRNRLA